MKISTILIWGCAVVGFAFPVQAKTQKIVGVIAGVNSDSLQVTTKEGSAESIRLDQKTAYMKWVTHRPWGQDTRMDHSSLWVGRCVNVELRDGQPATAKLVHVNDDPTGSIWDPCHR